MGRSSEGAEPIVGLGHRVRVSVRDHTGENTSRAQKKIRKGHNDRDSEKFPPKNTEKRGKVVCIWYFCGNPPGIAKNTVFFLDLRFHAQEVLKGQD